MGISGPVSRKKVTLSVPARLRRAGLSDGIPNQPGDSYSLQVLEDKSVSCNTKCFAKPQVNRGNLHPWLRPLGWHHPGGWGGSDQGSGLGRIGGWAGTSKKMLPTSDRVSILLQHSADTKSFIKVRLGAPCIREYPMPEARFPRRP